MFQCARLRHFSVLLTGWVLTVGVHTINRVILTAGLHESEHFSSAYNFFLRRKWDVDRVACEIFFLIVETFLSDAMEYESVVDDTLHNHMGPKIFGVAVQHDGNAPKTGKPVGYGVCFVTIGLTVRLEGISDRVFCLPFAARLWWPQKTKYKPTKARYKTKNELALELINLTRTWMPNAVTLRVIVDGGYSNRILLGNRPKGVHITGKVRSDAALYSVPEPHSKPKRGRPRKKGERLPTPKSMFNDLNLDWDWIDVCLYGKQVVVVVYRFKAVWYKAAGNEPLSIVLVWDPTGEYPDTVYFDTDTASSEEATIERFSHRWSTEITYRETKSLLGADNPQCRKELSVKRAPMAYWSYSLVTIWFVEQLRLGKDILVYTAPWYAKKNHFTFSDMLAAARRSHIAPIISRESRKQARDIKIISTYSNRRSKVPKTAKL